jgi:hypothetical protein
VTSFVSLYWGLVGLDSTLNGFDWIILTVAGLFSFGFGLTAILLTLKKKLQPLVIAAITAPMITNMIAVKSALDAYKLTTPWLILIAPFVLSVVSAFMICNADEQFT